MEQRHPAPLKLVRLDKSLPLPTRAHPTDAGIDLYAATDCTIEPGARQLVGTGIAIGLNPGTVGLIHPRTQEQMLFEAPWPEDFAYLVDVLRQDNAAY